MRGTGRDDPQEYLARVCIPHSRSCIRVTSVCAIIAPTANRRTLVPRKRLTDPGTSPRERIRVSTAALKAEGGARRNYRFLAETLRHLEILKSLPDVPKTETAVIAWALKTVVGRRTKRHEPRPGDDRNRPGARKRRGG